MKKIICIAFILASTFFNFSFAATFNNINYEMPKNHYISTNDKNILHLTSNDISSNNIVIRITPVDDDWGYINFSYAEFKKHVSLLHKMFNTASNSEMAKILGVPESVFPIGYRTPIGPSTCKIVEITKHNADAIKCIINSEIQNNTFVQTGYYLPNGKNCYYIAFTGDYTNDEMNSFLSSVSITGFVEKSTLSYKIMAIAVCSVILVLIAIAKTKYSKTKKIKAKNEIQPDDYIYNSSLSNIEEQKRDFIK